MLRFDSAYLSADDPRLICGTVQEQEEAQREFRRQRAIREILATVKREIPRSDLTFGRRWIELESSGELFNPWAGDVGFAPKGVAYYMDETGFPRLLEPADPPDRAELARRQAAKVKRRAAREAEIAQLRAQRLAEAKAAKR